MIYVLGFLLLMVPPPYAVIEAVVRFLQVSSAETTHLLFKAIGMPVLRESTFVFALPGVSIEVAEECSGIRSSSSLFVSSMLGGYMFLRSPWNRGLFTLLTIPVVIFKNALRIVGISWLGVYVDPDFLFGAFHRNSGIPFSLVALGILFLIIRALQRLEDRKSAAMPQATAAPAR
jgi:exosortase